MCHKLYFEDNTIVKGPKYHEASACLLSIKIGQ